MEIDGIQYSGATVAFLGPTHRFLRSYGCVKFATFLSTEIYALNFFA